MISYLISFLSAFPPKFREETPGGKDLRCKNFFIFKGRVLSRKVSLYFYKTIKRHIRYRNTTKVMKSTIKRRPRNDT